MGHPRFSLEEIGRRGQELYEQSIRPHVETEENIGKQIVIDIETGDYEIDDDGLAASRTLPVTAVAALNLSLLRSVPANMADDRNIQRRAAV